MMVEQLGNEPIPEEIPVEYEDFPYDVQEAIQIFTILPDVWEGMSGSYLGKNYSILPYLMDSIFEVANKQQTMQLLLVIGKIVMDNRIADQKARERKAKHKKGK
jgi:hypothetical protein